MVNSWFHFFDVTNRLNHELTWHYRYLSEGIKRKPFHFIGTLKWALTQRMKNLICLPFLLQATFGFISKLKFLLQLNIIKFMYSEKATKFCAISTILLTVLQTVKSKVEISQNFVAFSEYVNFNNNLIMFSPSSLMQTTYTVRFLAEISLVISDR